MRFVYVLLFATLLAVSATRLRGHHKSAKNQKQQHKYQDIIKPPNSHPKALSASLESPLSEGKFQGNILTVGEQQFKSAELDFGPSVDALGIHPIEKYITLTAAPYTMQINPSAALNPMPKYLSAEFDAAPGAKDIKESLHIENGREIPNTLRLHYVDPRIVRITKADIVDVKHHKKSNKNKKQKTAHKSNKAHHTETNLIQLSAKVEQIPEETQQFPYLIDQLPEGVTQQSLDQGAKEFINSNVKVSSDIPPLPTYDATKYNNEQASYVVSEGHVVGQENHDSAPQSDQVQEEINYESQEPQKIQQDIQSIEQQLPEQQVQEIRQIEPQAVQQLSSEEVREQNQETVMEYQQEPEQQYQVPIHQQPEVVQEYDDIPQMNQQEVQQHIDEVVPFQQQQVQEEFGNYNQEINNQQTQEANQQENNQQTQQEDPNTVALREYLKSLQEVEGQQAQSMVQTEQFDSYPSLLQINQEAPQFAQENIEQSQQQEYEQKQYEMVEDVEFEQKYLQDHELVDQLDETLIDSMIPQNNVFVHTLHTEFFDQNDFFKSLDAESAPHFTDYDGSSTYVNPEKQNENNEEQSHINEEMIIQETKYEGDMDTVNTLQAEDAQIKLPEEQNVEEVEQVQQLQVEQVQQVTADPQIMEAVAE